MNPWKKKDVNMKHAEAVITFFKNNYVEETQRSIAESLIYSKDIKTDIPDLEKLESNCRVIFEQSTSEDYIRNRGTEDTETLLTVLNFASYKKPGGMFVTGSNAQEESLCHASNLYNIISNEKFKDGFYGLHQSKVPPTYDNDLIYTPDVIFMDVDDKYFHGQVKVNVITCAAPNRNAAKKYFSMDDDVISAAMKDRIDHVLFAEYDWQQKHNEKRVLILGAFGCGVFMNKIDETAEFFKELIETKYGKVFDEIVFAIPDNRTFNMFRNAYIGRKPESMNMEASANHIIRPLNDRRKNKKDY